MGFSRQEYWSGLPCPSPEDLPDPGIEPWSPALLMQAYREGKVPTYGRALELFEINNVLRENENDDPLMVFAQVYYPFNFGGPFGASG